MTWTAILDQLMTWLQDPPQCAGCGKLGVVPIHVAVKYAKHAMESGIEPPDVICAANEGIDIYWNTEARFWRANRNGTVSAWEVNP